MKSLCYVLAINVVLSAADNLDTENASDESKVESRKIKHTISRIYSLPHNLARSAHNNENYNQLMKLLKDQSFEKQEISANETDTELNDVATDTSEKIKSAKEISEIHDETTNNDLTENTSKFFLLANKNANKERDIDNIVSKKETELTADTLNEIIQNLKASNVSNLGLKQIRKGKLVIYYDDNEGSSEIPIEINNNSKNIQLDVEKFSQIDDEIHNLFTQHKVPEKIFYTIKRRVHIEPKERTKNLITAFVKYMVYKGQLNWEIINKLKNFIGNNNIDMDLVKLLISLRGSNDAVKTESHTDEATNVIKNNFDNAEHITEQGMQKSNISTFLDLPIINSVIHVHKKQKNDKADEITNVNMENSNFLLHPNNEAITTKDKIIINTEQNESLDTEMDLKLDEDILQTALKRISSDEDDFEVLKSGTPSLQIPDLKNYYNNKNNKIKLSEDTLNAIISPLTQTSKGNCDLYDDCEAEKKLYTFDFDALKMILNGAITDVVPHLQQVNSSVPVFSNIPVEEYLHYNNRKPFFIYVVFSDPEKNSEISDNPTKIDPHFKIPDVDTIIKNKIEKLLLKTKFAEKYNLSSILHMIKKVIENKSQEIDTGIVDTFPEIYSPEDVLNIISKPKQPNNSHNSHAHNKNYPESNNSKNELIYEIFDNIFNKKNKTKLYPEDQTLDILKNLTHTTDDDETENNIIIEKILNLLPNIIKKPKYNAARERNENNVIERIKELFLNSENYSPEKVPDVEELKKITKDPYSFKIIIQRILQDMSNIKKMKLKTENENMDHSTEELIEQMKYLRKVLQKRNVPQHIQREVIKKEIEKGIFKIITESVAYCTKKAKKTIEMSITKALLKN